MHAGFALASKLQDLKMDPAFLNRNVNEGFSGGEKKRNEILQLATLEVWRSWSRSGLMQLCRGLWQHCSNMPTLMHSIGGRCLLHAVSYSSESCTMGLTRP